MVCSNLKFGTGHNFIGIKIIIIIVKNRPKINTSSESPLSKLSEKCYWTNRTNVMAAQRYFI